MRRKQKSDPCGPPSFLFSNIYKFADLRHTSNSYEVCSHTRTKGWAYRSYPYASLMVKDVPRKESISFNVHRASALIFVWEKKYISRWLAVRLLVQLLFLIASLRRLQRWGIVWTTEKARLFKAHVWWRDVSRQSHLLPERGLCLTKNS